MMKHFLLRGILGLISGAICGVIIGLIVIYITWDIDAIISMFSEVPTILRIALFGLGGAVLVGILGLIIGLAIAALKKPKS